MATAPAIDAPKRAKILLVDDTPENLIALEAALDSLGEELVLARSGREALRHLLDNEFAAILLDVKMPDMDGFETAELIRSRPRSRSTPILFLTGYKNEEHLFRGYDLGAVDFLFKPIVPEVLRSKVAVFVELSRKADLLEQQAKVLTRAEQQFRSLLEAAPDAMVICDALGQMVLVNSCAEALFGYTRSQMLGEHIRGLVPAWTFEGRSAAGMVSEQHGVPPLELEGKRRDGSIFPIEISRSPLQVEGELLITTAIRDITVRKQIERERALAEEQIRSLNAHLEALNTSLEERVQERTEALVRSNDELAQFAYVASHDLQEPVRTVSLYTQLIAERYMDVLDENGRTFLEFVVTNASRMEQLIRDLLEYSSVDATTRELSPTSCDTALDIALRSLQFSITESCAVIDRVPLPVVRGEQTQLARLFQNLISNAIKYRHPERAPEIAISAARDGGEWVFSIRDNGTGIESEFTERVFGIFKRLYGREKPGTGMGLAICRKIVSRLGGRIWVESTAGEGSSFLFRLPAVDDMSKVA